MAESNRNVWHRTTSRLDAVVFLCPAAQTLVEEKLFHRATIQAESITDHPPLPRCVVDAVLHSKPATRPR